MSQLAAQLPRAARLAHQQVEVVCPWRRTELDGGGRDAAGPVWRRFSLSLPRPAALTRATSPLAFRISCTSPLVQADVGAAEQRIGIAPQVADHRARCDADGSAAAARAPTCHQPGA